MQKPTQAMLLMSSLCQIQMRNHFQLYLNLTYILLFIQVTTITIIWRYSLTINYPQIEKYLSVGYFMSSLQRGMDC